MVCGLWFMVYGYSGLCFMAYKLWFVVRLLCRRPPNLDHDKAIAAAACTRKTCRRRCAWSKCYNLQRNHDGFKTAIHNYDGSKTKACTVLQNQANTSFLIKTRQTALELQQLNHAYIQSHPNMQNQKNAYSYHHKHVQIIYMVAARIPSLLRRRGELEGAASQDNDL